LTWADPGASSINLYGHLAERIGSMFCDGLWEDEAGGIDSVCGFRKALADRCRKLAPPMLRRPAATLPKPPAAATASPH